MLAVKDEEVKAKTAALAESEKKLKQSRSQAAGLRKRNAELESYSRQLQRDVESAENSYHTTARDLLNQQHENVAVKIDLDVEARKVVALQKKLDAIKALLGPDAAPVDPSRVADILSAAGGGQAADE